MNIDSLINQGNAYWGKRANPKSAKLAVLFYEKAFELNHANLNLAASLSEAYYFQANFERKCSHFGDRFVTVVCRR